MNIINIYINYDAPEAFSLGFQDPGSLISKDLVFFHDNIFFYILFILFVVGWLMLISIINKRYYSKLSENIRIEFLWTVLPVFILLAIVSPSLKILYLMDEYVFTPLTIKIIGHQWYWSYEYPNTLNSLEFDSYMTQSSDLEFGSMRLLEVDNKLILPSQVATRLVVTSTDVIHSFACPSLAVKIDAIPGRLNQGGVFCSKIGYYYGQCSEICGSDHSFMPISIQTLPLSKFLFLFNKS